MKKKLILIALSGTMIVVAGCSSNKNTTAGSAPQAMPSQATSSDMAMYETKNMEAGYAEGEYYGINDDTFSEELAVDGTLDSASSASYQELMFIKSANISLRSGDFDNDIINIRNTVNNYEGYFESSNLYSSSSGQKQYKRYNGTIRVPVENYEMAKEALENIGALYMSNESSKEVSGEYFNIQSRLETAKSEEKRLLELIDETYDMKQLIQLEQRLGEVSTQIELYETQLKRIESLTSYSTIVVDVTEVAAEDLIIKDDSFFTRLGDSFKNSVDATVGFFQNVLVFLTYIIVPLAILLFLAFVGICIFKKIKKKERHEKNTGKDKEKE